MTGLGGNCCAQLERGLPPGDVLATLNFFACSLAKTNQWRGSLHNQNWSKLFIFAYSCFWYSKEVPFVRQVCGCAPVTWLRKFFEKWQALQIEDPNSESALNYIILYRHVTISQERFILFPWNLTQNGQETSHNSWLPAVSWTFCHWNTSVLFPAPGAESIVRFAKEQHRKAGSTSGARASMGSYPQHTQVIYRISPFIYGIICDYMTTYLP